MKYWLYNHIIDNIALMGSCILFVPTEGVIHIIILQLKLQLVAIVINENKCTKWKGYIIFKSPSKICPDK